MNYIIYSDSRYEIKRHGRHFVWENEDETNRLGNPPPGWPNRRIWAYGEMTSGHDDMDSGLSFETEFDAIEWGFGAASHEMAGNHNVDEFVCEVYQELEDWDDHR